MAVHHGGKVGKPPTRCVNSGKELTQGDCWLTIRSAKAQDGLWIYKLSTAHLCAY